MGRTHDISRPQIDTPANRNGFLPATHIDAAHDLALPVELPLDAVLQFPRQLHVIKDIDLGFSRRNSALNRFASECVRVHGSKIHLCVLKAKLKEPRYSKDDNAFKVKTGPQGADV